MSGRGKGAKSAKASKKNQSRTARAGLQFPVGRVHRLLKNGRYTDRIGKFHTLHLQI